MAHSLSPALLAGISGVDARLLSTCRWPARRARCGGAARRLLLKQLRRAKGRPGIAGPARYRDFAAGIYEITVQVCRALAYIHFHGITHFDVKPENILITEGEDGLAVKLIDFGLSEFGFKVEGESTKGTIRYMAPEVLEGKRGDSRSDLYSLGVTLLEVLAGPFGEEGPAAAPGVHKDTCVRENCSLSYVLIQCWQGRATWT